MKAVILVGGFGTRLRPFTFTKPKSLIPFANVAILEHQISALVEVGVTDVILAVGHMSHQLEEMKPQLEEKYKITIHFSVETEPLGTAGPLSLCRELLLTDDNPFFMLNSDVASEFPFASMLNYHNSHQREGTIFVTPVEDPSKYGLVVFNKETGAISEFLEKPKSTSGTYPSRYINAGMYLLNKSVLNRMPLVPEKISIERQIFPKMVIENNLHAMRLDGYWMDIGQPRDFLIGTRLHLKSLSNAGSNEVTTSNGGIIMIHPTATVDSTAVIGPNVVVGPKCIVGPHARLINCTLMESTTIKQSAFIKNSIIGWGSRIAAYAKVEDSFLGADIGVEESVIILNTSVCPHKDVSEHSFSGIIM